jgi:hypothetical protein
MKNYNASRRDFLKKSAITTGVVAMGSLGISNATLASNINTNSNKLPREVWIAGISQMDIITKTTELMVEKCVEFVSQIAIYQPDIICFGCSLGLR